MTYFTPHTRDTGTLLLRTRAPQAMGFDFEEGDPEDPFKEMREEESEEGVGGEEGEGALPEPDSEGRKMAESAEVRGALQQSVSVASLLLARFLLGFFFSRGGAACYCRSLRVVGGDKNY